MQKNTARSAKATESSYDARATKATESSYHIDMMLSEEKNTGHQVVGRSKQTVARASLLATPICVIEATNSQQAKTGQAVKRISKFGEVSLLARKTSHTVEGDGLGTKIPVKEMDEGKCRIFCARHRWRCVVKNVRGPGLLM